jgi:hypothetical protein
MSYHDDLYNLNMMETKNISEFQITRVPNGWIFRSTTIHYNREGILINGSESMTFVPYSDEFNIVS